MKILIGGAWPYANGSLHIGHLAALLPGDVLARYYRAKGEQVYYVSGSDCYGTPVAIRARQEGKSPEEISDHYHAEFVACFERLGFQYDRYGKTSSGEHRDFVWAFHRIMYEGEFIYEKEAVQAFCEACGLALADRLVAGSCPACGVKARGDQCDACGTVLEPEGLIDPVCSGCGETVTFRQTKHLFIAISKMEVALTAYLDAHPDWRKNAVAFTRRYIEEGLRDRAVTRDLEWGIEVPAEITADDAGNRVCGDIACREGSITADTCACDCNCCKPDYKDKRIYIWAENVLGYLSMAKAVAEERGEDYDDLWGPDSRHYYVHGKDNIPFHTIILPALMLANGGNWKLPDDIISSEYLTLEGRKISTSQNWAIRVKDIAWRYDPDSIRYFMIANGPEKRDSDFSWREFVNSHNGELLGAYGNFVNRSLAFVRKYFDGAVPTGGLDGEIGRTLETLFPAVGGLIETGGFKEALDTVFDLVRTGNRYFDARRPWDTRESDPQSCRDTLFTCVQLIANLALLLEPFLPFSSAKVKKWLGVAGGWRPVEVEAGFAIPEPELLFQRLDKSVIEEELARL